MPSKLEYRQPSTPRNVQQADYADITQLNAVLPQFPTLIELVRIRLCLLEKEKHEQTRENLGRGRPDLQSIDGGYLERHAQQGETS